MALDHAKGPENGREDAKPSHDTDDDDVDNKPAELGASKVFEVAITGTDC